MFDATSSLGRFAIDTCCFSPANHLFFETFTAPFSPLFTRGVVTISDACVCGCHADPACDSVSDVRDIVSTIDEAFRAGATEIGEMCPEISRSDVNCDCQVDIVDVVLLINKAFRGDTAPFCDPCQERCR